jgi:hypothetical protein
LLTSRVGVINLAMGRPDLQWKFQLISTPLVIASLFVGIGYGALGVSLSYALAQFFMSFLSLSLAFPLVELSIVRYFQRFGWVFVCLGGCGLVGWGLQNLLVGVDWPPYLTTAVFSTIILALFGLSLYTLDRQMRSIVQTSGHWLQQRYRASHASHLS